MPATETGEVEVDLATRRRAEILCGSIHIVARDGIVAAKLKDIARESGVSLGLIQHYFDTKENLVEATFAAMMEVISRETKRKTGSVADPLQLIFETIRIHVYGSVDFPGRWGFWSELWAGSGRSEHLRSVSTQIYGLWARPLESAVRELKMQDRLPGGIDPERFTIGMLALTDGLAIRTLAEPEIFTQDLMLQVLNDWAVVQLGVDSAQAAVLLEQLTHDPRDPGPMTLTPELIAGALVDSQEAAPS